MNPPTLITNTRLVPGSPDALAIVRSSVEEEFSFLQVQHPRLLELVLNEAEALAWDIGCPELIFPTLAQEKAEKLSGWHAAQARMQRSGPALAFAA